MDQLQEIVQMLSSGDEGTTNALLKTKVLLYSIGKKELASWVNHELNGYPSEVELPSYRTVPARLLVNANNGVRSYKGIQVPLAHLNDDEYEDVSKSRVRVSISQIEHLVINARDKTSLIQSIPLEIAYSKYCKFLESDYEITSCYKDISVHYFTSILTQVRSRLLDFVLELSDQVAAIPGTTSMEEKLKEVDSSSLFNQTIFGDNTVINLGDNNSLIVTNNAAKNDFPALKKQLLDNGFEKEDVEELEVAIKTDGPIAGKKAQYGSAVGTWLANVISKAANTSIGISVAAATEVATKALKRYYGFD
ncbi:hypothetical protein V2E82_003658 [Klebsiella aerogenes]|nr:hypothetical protein [Klebsiella aerogenes]HDS6684720.1 hypothetical protein [Klebsiella aerogenes]HEP0873451.1 hypothetical protein [Klebsiella aerogenes]